MLWKYNFGTCGLKFPLQYRVVPAPLRLYQRPLERDKADQRLPPSIWISHNGAHFCPHGCLASFPCMVVQGNGRLFQQWLEKGPPSLIVPPGCHCGDTLLRCLCLLCGNQKDCWPSVQSRRYVEWKELDRPASWFPKVQRDHNGVWDPINPG